jgi:class 3 adenylate cyclase/predicted ATPase
MREGQMPPDVRDWLLQFELEDLAPVFQKNQVGIRDLPLLTEHDLKELGIALGPRRRLLHAISMMAEAGDLAETPSPNHGESGGAVERRQLCVMFVDIVGSTELSRRLDPEDLREATSRYQDAVTAAVLPYGGHIAKYLGDGVLVYFGWPQAYEDQVERAVRAGLDVASAVGRLRVIGGEVLAARIGIATGHVVVGDIVGRMGRDVDAISGETPNLAARLQQLAAAGEIVIDTPSARQIGQIFAITDLGEQRLKGFGTGVRAWRIVGETPADSRFEAVHGMALSRMVGRDSELQLLMDRWELARGGEGQAIFVSGEAGIGKSRLLQSLQANVRKSNHIPIRYQCSPHHANSALYPAVRQLERAARFSSKESAETKIEKLEALLARTDAALVADAPLFADLLSLPGEERYGQLMMPPQQRRERLLEALLNQLLVLATNKPVLFLFEDTHWIDPTSLVFLERVLARIQTARILFAVTHRPEWRPPSMGLSNVTLLQLNHLGRVHGAAIVRALSGDDLDPDLVERIVARTDGVPLFIEELTKSLLEVGPESIGAEIPATIQASLTERLDRLGPAKEIAQIGAVIGREFPLDVITAVAGKPPDALNEAVENLVRSELVFRRGHGTEQLLSFKHALVRDTAYESLLHAARRDWHRRIASTLEDRFGTFFESEPEVIAQHWIEAGDNRRAIPLLLRSGHAASARSATTEAAAHFYGALDLFDALGRGDRIVEQELEILVSLGPALMNAKGFAHPDVGRVWLRAYDVSRRSTTDHDLFLIVWNLWLHHHVGNERSGTIKWRDEVVRLAEKSCQEEHRLQAYHAVWTTDMPRGHFAEVRAQCEAGISIYDPERHHQLTYSYGGHDPGVCGHGQAALATSILGYLERGERHAREAIRLAESLEHGPTLTIAWGWHGLLQVVNRTPSALVDRAEAEAFISEFERGVAVIERYGSPHFLPNCQCGLGWAKVTAGRVQQGLSDIKSGIESYRGTGATLRLPIFLYVLAETSLAIGDHAGASQAVQDALEIIDQDGDRTFWAELMRVRAEIALAESVGPDGATETLFRQAIEVAQGQEARLSELRAGTRLAELMHAQGRREDARNLLAPIYTWFTEGLQSRDLVAARELIDRLD